MIFLASPYRDSVPGIPQWRYELALHFCADHLLSAPHPRPIYSPIVHWHPVAEINPELQKKGIEFWMAINRPMLEMCDSLWVLGLPGWEQSEGVAKEIAVAKDLGKPVMCATQEPYKHEISWTTIS